MTLSVTNKKTFKTIPVATQSEASVCGRLLLGLHVQIPPEAWMSVCYVCCVLTGKVL